MRVTLLYDTTLVSSNAGLYFTSSALIFIKHLMCSKCASKSSIVELWGFGQIFLIRPVIVYTRIDREVVKWKGRLAFLN
jgi:hypothetical protein